MTRKTITTNKIALLATGDEIIHGDILNSNSQEIAARLFNAGMQIGTHMTAPDITADIETAIHFLLQDHRALIITGGLGPTSDDLTRYALANVLKKQLVFDEATWNEIVARLKRFGYENPPETNRRQALFPEDAEIITNPNGTAAGCKINYNNHLIFMLPGPPPECLPIVDKIVLPALIQAQFQQINFYQKWLLFGVSEGQIAEELDALAKPFDCITGYRLWYPYIEFKLHSNNYDDFQKLTAQVNDVVAPYIIGDGTNTASEILKQTMLEKQISLDIKDNATGGLLESIIKTPKTISFLTQNAKLKIEINGLNEYWNSIHDTTQTSIEIHFTEQNNKQSVKTTIPFRGARVKNYAVEFACWKILEFIHKTARH